MSVSHSPIQGRIWDAATGRPLEARVCVIASNGRFCFPQGSIASAAPSGAGVVEPTAGYPFFYSEGAFSVDVPSGPAQIIVERGTEYARLTQSIAVPHQARVDVDLPLSRWTNMPEQGWYAGNTHVHYPEAETAAEERLRLDPRVEDLPVMVVSVLQRGTERPASNAFPIGVHRLSDADHVIDIGEEVRHNSQPWEIGLGHIMLINLRRLITPVSRGVLVDAASPDFPPLVDACDTARGDGAVVLWCHNGVGMEAPVAAILGRLDGMNLFDPCWMDPEYAIWYRLLNCGVRLPISTGSDWYVCSSNRVYAEVGTDFSYAAWLAALKQGRTFATNGPILQLHVDGFTPSNDSIEMGRRRRANVGVSWSSDVPIDVVEVVCDGVVAAAQMNCDGDLAGTMSARIDVADVGWIAARASGGRRARFGQATWSHTSPVYLRSGSNRAAGARAAAEFCRELITAEDWVRTKARFDSPAQQTRMLQLFASARGEFMRLT
jgi:hypothetical protein